MNAFRAIGHGSYMPRHRETSKDRTGDESRTPSRSHRVPSVSSGDSIVPALNAFHGTQRFTRIAYLLTNVTVQADGDTLRPFMSLFSTETTPKSISLSLFEMALHKVMPSAICWRTMKQATTSAAINLRALLQPTGMYFDAKSI